MFCGNGISAWTHFCLNEILLFVTFSCQALILTDEVVLKYGHWHLFSVLLFTSWNKIPVYLENKESGLGGFEWWLKGVPVHLQNSCGFRLCFYLMELRSEHSNKSNSIKGMGFNTEDLSSSALKWPFLIDPKGLSNFISCPQLLSQFNMIYSN